MRTSIAIIGIFSMLVSAAPNNDLVRCIGADGHIEIERSTMGGCSSWHGMSENDIAAPIHSTTAHCGICVDIPLENSLYSAQEKPDRVVPKLFESVTGFLATRFPQITVFNSNGAALTAAAVHGRAVLILKTVILII